MVGWVGVSMLGVARIDGQCATGRQRRASANSLGLAKVYGGVDVFLGGNQQHKKREERK